MSAFEQSINPYAPPTSNISGPVRPSIYLWREGDTLVIRSGAELPPYCLVTGGPAPYSHPISQIWQPKWVYLLLPFAIFPYAIASSFVYRQVELNVPFSKSLYRKHQRWVNFGIFLMLTGGLLIICFGACVIGSWMSGPIAMILVCGILLLLVGMQVASRQPLRLDIIKVEDDLIYVRNVHPDYLAHLPDALDPMSYVGFNDSVLSDI